MLVITMYIGRGDSSAKNWRSEIRRVMDTFQNAELAWRHVYRKWSFADCLQEGLKRLMAAGINVDAMPDELLEKSAVVT